MKKSFITIKTGKKELRRICISEIIYVIYENSISTIHTTNDNIPVNKFLAELELELTNLGMDFFRANRNTLINLNHLTSFQYIEKPSVEMSNKEKLQISRRKLSSLIRKINTKDYHL